MDIEGGQEWQGFQAVQFGNTEAVAITGFQLTNLDVPSHHFTVSLWQDESSPPVGGPHDFHSEQGREILDMVAARPATGVAFSGYQQIDVRLGAHVGIPIGPDATLINNGHYFNTSEQAATGQTHLQFQMVPTDEVSFLTDYAAPTLADIDIPPGQSRTAGGVWVPPTDAAVILMSSHMHRHGVLFRVFATVDGEQRQVYESDDYRSPPLTAFGGDDSPLLVLRPERGDFLRYECTFRNHDLDTNIRFGPWADRDEMCTMPLYYVQQPDDLMELMAIDGSGIISRAD